MIFSGKKDVYEIKQSLRDVSKDLDLIDKRLDKLEKQPTVEEKGKGLFAEKRVQTIVYGLIGLIIAAAGSGWVAGSGIETLLGG